MKALGSILLLAAALTLHAAVPTPVFAPPVPVIPGQAMIKGLPRVYGDTVGLNLYLSTKEKTGFNKVNPEPITSERYLVKDLVAGQQYWVAVTALVKDASGTVNESKPSEKWQVVAQKVRGDETPTPGPQKPKEEKPVEKTVGKPKKGKVRG